MKASKNFGVCEECGRENFLTKHHVWGGKAMQRLIFGVPESWRDKEIVMLCVNCHKRRHHMTIVYAKKSNPSYEQILEYLNIRSKVLGKRLGGLSVNPKFVDTDELKKLQSRVNELNSIIYILKECDVEHYIEDQKEELEKIRKNREKKELVKK